MLWQGRVAQQHHDAAARRAAAGRRAARPVSTQTRTHAPPPAAASRLSTASSTQMPFVDSVVPVYVRARVLDAQTKTRIRVLHDN